MALGLKWRIQVIFYFNINLRWFRGAQILRIWALKLYLLIIRHAKNLSHYMAVFFIVTLCRRPLLKVQFHPGNRRRIPLFVRRRRTMFQMWLHYTPHTIFLHAKYHFKKLGHMVVLNIWNVDVQQRQWYLTWAELFYILQFQISYLAFIYRRKYLWKHRFILFDSDILHCIHWCCMQIEST